MNATITVVCYKSKTLSNGEHPLMLRICKDGKKKYQSLGVSIKANQWDFVRERPKPTCPNKAWLNKYEKWLRSKGNKETTMSLLFRTLRSAYNKAIESKCARKSDYPFNDYRISKFDVSTEKRAIAKADVLKFSTDVRPIGNGNMFNSVRTYSYSVICVAASISLT